MTVTRVAKSPDDVYTLVNTAINSLNRALIEAKEGRVIMSYEWQQHAMDQMTKARDLFEVVNDPEGSRR